MTNHTMGHCAHEKGYAEDQLGGPYLPIPTFRVPTEAPVDEETHHKPMYWREGEVG
jgi:hypothetical protein